VVEQALAHTIGNAVEAAYPSGDLFAKRVALMADWAACLAQPAAQVVPAAPPGRPVGGGERMGGGTPAGVAVARGSGMVRLADDHS
jgi:hypothetical protein